MVYADDFIRRLSSSISNDFGRNLLLKHASQSGKFLNFTVVQDY